MTPRSLKRSPAEWKAESDAVPRAGFVLHAGATGWVQGTPPGPLPALPGAGMYLASPGLLPNQPDRRAVPSSPPCRGAQAAGSRSVRPSRRASGRAPAAAQAPPPARASILQRPRCGSSTCPIPPPWLPPPPAPRPTPQLHLVRVGGQQDVELGFCRSIHLGPERRRRATSCPARLRARRKMGFAALRCLSHRSLAGGREGRERSAGRGRRAGRSVTRRRSSRAPRPSAPAASPAGLRAPPTPGTRGGARPRVRSAGAGPRRT